MGARVGTGLVEFHPAPFAAARASGSLISEPDAGLHAIRAISRIKFPQFAYHAFRFYLETGDAGSGERFLQVLATPDGEVTELMYCSSLHRLIPESEEEQNFFTGENPDGLGSLEFSLLKDQLAALGIPDLDRIFPLGTDTLAYRRADGSDDGYRPPMRGTETRVDDAGGEHGLRQDICLMPYARPIGIGAEFLLISTEIVGSKDGAACNDVHVDFMIGLVVDKASVRVI